MWCYHLDRCCTCTGWSVSALHHRRFSVGKGDLLVMVCSLLFSLHILVIDYFSPKVDGVKMSCIQFFVCGFLCDPGCLYGTYGIGRYLCRLGTDSLCRCDVLRCCVHPADHRTERYEPDCGFSDLKSGILHLGTGRLDPVESEAFRPGVIRMCADVCSDHSGTASIREKSILYMILKKTSNCEDTEPL